LVDDRRVSLDFSFGAQIGLLGGAATLPLAAQAQQPKSAALHMSPFGTHCVS
jgi:hypothetical protein